jgi:hypothetical protein
VKDQREGNGEDIKKRKGSNQKFKNLAMSKRNFTIGEFLWRTQKTRVLNQEKDEKYVEA